MDSNKKEEPVTIRPLPRWIRRAFGLRDEAKRERIFTAARDQGFTLQELLAGHELHKLKLVGKPN